MCNCFLTLWWCFMCSNWSAQFGIIGNKSKTSETSSCATYLSTAPGNSVFPEAAASTHTARWDSVVWRVPRTAPRWGRSLSYLVMSNACNTQADIDFTVEGWRRSDQPHLSSVCVLLYAGKMTRVRWQPFRQRSSAGLAQGASPLTSSLS